MGIEIKSKSSGNRKTDHSNNKVQKKQKMLMNYRGGIGRTFIELR